MWSEFKGSAVDDDPALRKLCKVALYARMNNIHVIHIAVKLSVGAVQMPLIVVPRKLRSET